jgi:hypothetical protein
MITAKLFPVETGPCGKVFLILQFEFKGFKNSNISRSSFLYTTIKAIPGFSWFSGPPDISD